MKLIVNACFLFLCVIYIDGLDQYYNVVWEKHFDVQDTILGLLGFIFFKSQAAVLAVRLSHQHMAYSSLTFTLQQAYNNKSVTIFKKAPFSPPT